MQEKINKALTEFNFPINLNPFQIDGKGGCPYSVDDHHGAIRLGFINGTCLTLDIYELNYLSLVPREHKEVLFEIGYDKTTRGSYWEPPDIDYIYLYSTSDIYEALSVFHALDQTYVINNKLAADAEAEAYNAGN